MEWWLILLVVVLSCLLVYGGLSWFSWRRARSVDPSIPVVPVDPTEYKGSWYEVAAVPQWFERECTANVTAHYEPEGDRIRVTNTCQKGERTSVSRGWAWKANERGSLAVSFFRGFYGNYTVTYRDAATSVVTNGDKSALWILSRTPQMPEETWDTLTKWLTSHGFDLSRLKRTTQV